MVFQGNLSMNIGNKIQIQVNFANEVNLSEVQVILEAQTKSLKTQFSKVVKSTNYEARLLSVPCFPHL